MSRIWHIRPTTAVYGGFEVVPHVYDDLIRDWRQERARLLAPSWRCAVALIPAGNVKRAVAEGGGWWGPAPVERAAISEQRDPEFDDDSRETRGLFMGML